jgi:tellurite resistance protein
MDNEKRDLEEEYFRKQDQELIEKMRRAAAADEARRALGAQSGISDPALLREIEQLGFTPDTVGLLPLVPILQVAWAEGGVSPEERRLIVEVARTRGIVEGSSADRQLSDWMAQKPPQEVFARATRLIGAMLSAHSADSAFTADDLVKYAESIAAASGGIFGMNKISKEERAAIAQIQAALRSR